MNEIWAYLRGILAAAFWLVFIGYFGYRILRGSDDPAKIAVKAVLSLLFLPYFFFCLTAGPYAPIFILPGCVALAITWAPHIGAWLASPLTDVFDGGNEEVVPTPFYSIAEGKRKRSDFPGAIAEIQKQLEKFPGDYQGQMLLARIEAEHLHHLPVAQDIVETLVTQTGHAPPRVADALTQLADWQLRLGQDQASAQATLERIIARFPETQIALVAAQRIAHLTAPETFSPESERAPIPLKPREQNIGLRRDYEDLKKKEIDPETETADLVAHLQVHPLDTEARQKLAVLYAGHYQRLDLAQNELEQLVRIPNQAIKQVGRWLHLQADLHIKHAGDLAAAGKSLQRIVEMFPETATAENARTRLAYLPMELKGKEVTTSVALGQYESNLGLKKSRAQLDIENAERPFRNRA